MTHGLRQAGINVLAGVDNDPKCKETYEYNNPGSKFINVDITKYQAEELQNELQIPQNDDEMIFIGCSPCQYWSIINTNKTKSQQTKNLLVDFQRFIEYFKPGFVLVENVPGILKKSSESILPDFLKFLDDNGYNYDKNFLNLNHYGVPQNRIRFSLIASRIVGNIKLPEAESNENLTVQNFIGTQNGFPEISVGNKDNTDFSHTTMNLTEKNVERLRKTEKNGGTRLSWAEDETLQNPGYVGKNNSFRDVYGRMKWDKPAPTITTKFYSISNGRFAHPIEDRGISIREGATLQTFPKNYVFKTNSMQQAAKMIGNAVPPEFAKRIGKQIKSLNSRLNFDG